MKLLIMKSGFTFRKLFQYFLQGLIIIAPIVITMYAVTALFTFIDSILPELIARWFPHLLDPGSDGWPYRIPGLGFIVVIILVILVGYVSSSFIVGRTVELFDKVLERTPGVKLIYSTVKDFFEAFAGNKRKFNRAALVSVAGEDVWQIGFITQEDVKEFGLIDSVAVYIPKSYAFTGELFFVKKDRVRLLTQMSSANAMKFAISGGVTEIDEDHIQKPAPVPDSNSE
jgi:uncharacterized membrane protein